MRNIIYFYAVDPDDDYIDGTIADNQHDTESKLLRSVNKNRVKLVKLKEQGYRLVRAKTEEAYVVDEV